MLLRIEKRWIKTPRYVKKGKLSVVGVVSCDVCKKEFDVSKIYAENRSFHLCSKTCHKQARSKGGVIYNHYVELNQKYHGCEWSSQRTKVKEKVKTTNVEKYGFVASSQNELVKEKARKTCFNRYGGPSATNSSEIIDKIKATLQARYGGGHLRDPIKRQQFNATMLQRYGVLWPAQCSEIYEKVIKTARARYGNNFSGKAKPKLPRSQINKKFMKQEKRMEICSFQT